MTDKPTTNEHPSVVAPRRRTPTVLRCALALGILYLLIAYAALPLWWRHHEKRHPALADAPVITYTADGIPGDPLNVALVGGEEDLHRAMLAAGWHPADPITLKTAMRIAEGVVLSRRYDDAPVSSLYLWGRKEDLAFEQPVGNDPRSRHHVRFWRSVPTDEQGRPLWIGAATFDTGVGLSHTTGQITHHVAADVDRERDKLIEDIRRAGRLSGVEWIDGFHKVLSGHNGGGDPWHTDGRLAVATIAPQPTTQPAGR